MRLKDKLAVITAAASGMGRAGVELFAREGATVAAVDINAAALKAVASDANAKGGKVIPIVSDLSTVDGVRTKRRRGGGGARRHRCDVGACGHSRARGGRRA